MDHLLQTVFLQVPDSPIQKALEHNGYVTPEDFLMEKDETLDDLNYTDDASKFVKITKAGAGLFKTFRQFVAFSVIQGRIFDDDEWEIITCAEFNTFRSTYSNNTAPIVASTMQQSSVRPSPVFNLVRDFKRGI